MQLEIGKFYEGIVKSITSYGAFVDISGEGTKPATGMVHISEVANTYVSDIHDHLSDGQTVKVKVLSITPEGRINLSIKKTADIPAPAREQGGPDRRFAHKEEQAPASRAVHPPREAKPQSAGEPSFEDKLKQFMQESDSKMSGSRIYEQRKSTRRRRY